MRVVYPCVFADMGQQGEGCRPELNVRCLSSLLPSVAFEAGSLTGTGTQISWTVASHHQSLPPTLDLYRCATSPYCQHWVYNDVPPCLGFHMGAGVASVLTLAHHPIGHFRNPGAIWFFKLM